MCVYVCIYVHVCGHLDDDWPPTHPTHVCPTNGKQPLGPQVSPANQKPTHPPTHIATTPPPQLTSTPPPPHVCPTTTSPPTHIDPSHTHTHKQTPTQQPLGPQVRAGGGGGGRAPHGRHRHRHQGEQAGTRDGYIYMCVYVFLHICDRYIAKQYPPPPPITPHSPHKTGDRRGVHPAPAGAARGGVRLHPPAGHPREGGWGGLGRCE